MRYLNELTVDELKKVYENNKGIREIAFKMLTNRLRDELDAMYNEQNILGYFLWEQEIIADSLTNIYIDDDYIAYKTITKCYK